jgi:GT2 family glycosyltransferase
VTSPRLSVVVCTYTEARWNELAAGTRAVAEQLGADDELLVVVDHADALLERVRRELPGRAVPNRHPRGLSGGRNTGVEEAAGDVVLFLDDDALPGPGWVASYRRQFEDPGVTGVAGAVTPAWEGGSTPRWFPPEFGWVVGCDYVGLPADGRPVRNPIGASMGLRKDAVTGAGGFSELVGRVDTLPVGCEETELCIRMRQRDPAVRLVRDTSSAVAHLVPRSRQTWRYYASRCWHEGRSKALLSGLVGSSDALSSERSYVAVALPRGVLTHAAAAGRGDPAGLLRAAAIVLGLVITGAGYLSVRLRHRT